VATASAFTANDQTGMYTVAASTAGVTNPASFDLTNVVGAPSRIVATAGTVQFALVATAFATVLQATVSDGFGHPVPGVSVTFTAPPSGPSGTFANHTGTDTETTDGSGVAAASTFTANARIGTYAVRASVAGVGTPASFLLTNVGLPLPPQEYWLVTADGHVHPFGPAAPASTTPAHTPTTSAVSSAATGGVVGVATTPSGNGFWLVFANGTVSTSGDAGFFGSLAGVHLNQPVVGMAATPSGRGYWLVAGDGGVFSFGDAGFFGSTGSLRLNRPVVGMAATPSGRGYWLVAGDGGVFSFGDAGFFGSTGNLRLNAPVVAMGRTPTGAGYWLAAADGGVFTFGDALFLGSAVGLFAVPVVGMASA
jgi:hypothetical protein